MPAVTRRAQILAALAMACHELVPPEVLAPVLTQLVDQFINDRCVRENT